MDCHTFSVAELRAAAGLDPLTDSESSSDSELSDSTEESQELDENESDKLEQPSSLSHHTTAIPSEPVTVDDFQIIEVEVISENINANQQQNIANQDDEFSEKVFHGDLTFGRKLRKKAKPEEWKRNKNKRLRMQGMEYKGFQNVLVQTEDGAVQRKTVQEKNIPSKNLQSFFS